MTSTHSYRGIAWIDLESPNDGEIASVIKRYGLHPLVGEELKNSSGSAKINLYDDYILLSLPLPIRTKEKDGNRYMVSDREVDFVIGANFLVTSRYQAVDQLEYFAKIFETNSIIDKNEKVENASNLFYYMMKRLYAGMFNDLENIRDALSAAEDKIFQGDEKRMVENLSFLGRELIDFRQTARVHKDIWEQMLLDSKHNVLGEKIIPYIRDLRDDFNRIHELVGNCRELLSDLRETNDSMLSAKQNEVIKTLTMVSFIFIPLTFIASLFTIPSPFTPLVGHPQGWNLLFVFMVVLSVLTWWSFKRKKWL